MIWLALAACAPQAPVAADLLPPSAPAAVLLIASDGTLAALGRARSVSTRPSSPCGPLLHVAGRTVPASLTRSAGSKPQPLRGPLSRTLLATVEGTVVSELYKDLDQPRDDRDPWRYQLLDDAGAELYAWSTPAPVMVQTFLDYYGSLAGIDLLQSLPSLGAFAVQVPLLDDASTVRFQQRDAQGVWQDSGLYDLSQVEADDVGVSDEVVGYELLYGGGDPRYQLDIVLLPDGYTEAQLDRWRRDADALAEALISTAPLSNYAAMINIVRVDVPSAESGVSYDCVGGSCRWRDTAFGTIFAVELVNQLTGSRYSARAMFQAEQFEVARAASVVPWDQAIVVANTERYGGMAIHFATISNAESDWPTVGVHEFGHALGLLGDEYNADPCIRGDTLPLPPNITDDPTSPPWSAWIASDTPLPTTRDAGDVVGAYASAYNCPDIYRPVQRCMMRDYSPFGPVCAEQLVLRTFRFADRVHGFDVVDGWLKLPRRYDEIKATITESTPLVRADPYDDLVETRVFRHP